MTSTLVVKQSLTTQDFAGGGVRASDARSQASPERKAACTASGTQKETTAPRQQSTSPALPRRACAFSSFLRAHMPPGASHLLRAKIRRHFFRLHLSAQSGQAVEMFRYGRKNVGK